MKAELSEITYQLALIRQAVTAIQDRAPHRMGFDSGQEAALTTGVFLRQYYPIETVAGIAAACAGASRHERVIEALRLLEAAEDVAVPQHRNPYTAEQRENDELMTAAHSLLEKFPADGEINRVKLCVLACGLAGRRRKAAKAKTATGKAKTATGKAKTDKDKADHAMELFLEWADAAAERWELRTAFYAELDAVKEKLKDLRESLAGAKNTHDRAAIEKEIGALPTESSVYEIVSQRPRKEPNRAAFLATLEGPSAADNRVKVLLDEDRAIRMLVGGFGVEGFLHWLRRTKVMTTPPKRRAPHGDDGKHERQKRETGGQFKPQNAK